MFISRRMMIVFVLFAIRSAAPQTVGGFPHADSGSAPVACQVRVVANDVVVSDEERRAAAYQVQPAGIVPNPGQWPYFAWPDTQLGVVRTRDGAGYLFFGSDGGCHNDCNSKTPRSGSITVSQGTLDHPLGLPVADPSPPPSEFLLPTSVNLPATMDYVGGGPVYRIPEGEPGAGDLLIVYHAERAANPFWSWLGLAKSSDEGYTWQDLGLIISPAHAYNPDGAVDIGDSTLVAAPDSVTGQKYFYLFFGSDTTYLSVARAAYEELLEAVSQQNSGTSSTVASSFFHKYYDGSWDQPGIGGQQSEIFPAVTGQTDGDSQVAWSAYRHRFVAIMDNGQYIAYGESVDGLHWPAMQVLLGTNPQTAVYGYANAIGVEADPAILGDTFYSYYTDFPQGVSWQPATLNRLTITTAATLKSIAPASITAGGAGFALTVNGDHFVKGSIVMWNGSPRATTFVSATQLRAQILSADITGAGQARVTVWNPAPCGGNSNAIPISIQASMPPSVTLLAGPEHVFAGEPFTLTWSSTNAAGCTAGGDWNGQKATSGSEVITPEAAGKQTYSLVCSGTGGTGEADVRIKVKAPTLSMTENFSPNSLTIPTSEGSPYGFCDFWVAKASNCAKQTNFGYGPTKVMQVYICLSGEVSTSGCSQQPQVTGPLSAAMLKDMDERLAAFNGTGMRLLLRFTYNFGPIGPGAMDAPIDVIAENIDQVAPIVRRHKDLVFALEAGFIGTWGEWHDSTIGNETATAQKIVLDRERNYFDGLFPILVRDVGQLVQYTGTLAPQPGLGMHDDYYASNSSDASTWSTCATRSGFCLSGYTTEQFQTYGANVAEKVMFAGEFGAFYPPLQSCSALNQYSYTYHPQSITLHPYPAVGTELQNEGCVKSFYNKVGTRIVLQNVKVIGDARPGGRLYVTATMVNDGYGRVIRERPVDLILIQNGLEAGKIEIPIEKMDLRALASEISPVPSTFAFEIRLPESLNRGPLTMALFIKDPASSLHPKAAYALPLNSLDKDAQALFNTTDGLNRIATFDIDRRNH